MPRPSLGLPTLALFCGALSACTVENTPGKLNDAETGCSASEELCDGLDNDCDGVIDNDPVDAGSWYEDSDGDGYGGATLIACTAPDGAVDNADDCDDTNAEISPGAEERCDGFDNDCDALVDTDDPDLLDGTTVYQDADGDGYGDPASATVSCDPTSGVLDSSDCDDSEPTVSPAGEEICDEVDDDCDGVVDPDDCECGGPAESGLRVTITNSREVNSGHEMDLIWQGVANDLGYSTTIISRSALSRAGALDDTDILIVSSGVDTYAASEVAAIQAWLEGGGPAYLQTEYDCTYPANLAFAEIVGNLGASFSWLGTVSGDLGPLAASGCLSEYPEAFPGFDYYWYGCQGEGVPAFVSVGTQKIAFQYCPDDPSVGHLITTTDQDWISQAADYPDHKVLLRNILSALATSPSSCP